MIRIVVTTVAEIDASDEGNIVFFPAGTAEQEQLLMVRSTSSNTLVQNHLTARLIHDLAEMSPLLLTEADQARVRSPHEAPHGDPLLGQVRQHPAHLGPGAGEQLIGVSSPVGEMDPVARTQTPKLVVQPPEIGGSVDQRDDSVPARPRSPVVVPTIDLGRVVAPLGGC